MGVQTLKRSAFLTTVFAVAMVVPLVAGGPSLASSASREPSVVASTSVGDFVIRDDVSVTAAESVTASRNETTVKQSTQATSPSGSTSANGLAGTAIDTSTGTSDAPTVITTRDASHSSTKPTPTIPTPGAGSSDRDQPVEPQQGGGGCPSNVTGNTRTAPSRTSAGGVAGTTSDDIAAFATKFNAIRVANCIAPVPLANFKYDSCMEDRLFWMAEDPSTDPSSAWGHIGSKRSDGVPSVGCDGNLAGGSQNSGATVAQKWWDSLDHRAALYRPSFSGSLDSVCIIFAMTHGGVPNEPYTFTRAAARWVTC
jgi:hypothetical protein